MFVDALTVKEKEAGNFDLSKSERQKRRNPRGSLHCHSGGARTSDATQPSKRNRRFSRCLLNGHDTLIVRRSKDDRSKLHVRDLHRPVTHIPQSISWKRRRSTKTHPLSIVLSYSCNSCSAQKQPSIEPIIIRYFFHIFSPRCALYLQIMVFT